MGGPEHAATGSATQALVLFAHGSRDPLWHGPIQAVAKAIRARAPHLPVVCAYLELSQPDLPQVTAQLAAQGVRHITVIPMFLGVGKHARQDLPQLLAQCQSENPGVVLRATPSVGEDAQVIEVLASVALQALSPT